MKASLYRRGDSPNWWVAYVGTDGRRRLASTGTADKTEARKVLEQMRIQAAAREELGVVVGPLTVRAYGAGWLKRRKASGISSARDDAGRWRKWVEGSTLAAMPLAEVRVSHVRAFMADLRAWAEPETGWKPSPRTVLHVYGLLRVLFSDAVAEELTPASPCVLKTRRKELPRKRDAVAGWRSTAVFTPEEVVALASDARVPEDRRFLYGALFLSGMRFGELADRRVSDYLPGRRPLGCLLVASSFDVRSRTSKETKTGITRDVPVHPELAHLLEAWLSGGWERMLGRAPTPEDWLIPSPLGKRRLVNNALRRFHQDLEALGLRERRLHDARRTFISLALAGGARAELLRWVTHDPPTDQVGQYTTPPWDVLCTEVRRLAVELPRDAATLTATLEGTKEKAEQAQQLARLKLARSTGLEAAPARSSRAISWSHAKQSARLREASSRLARRSERQRSNVATPPAHLLRGAA